MNYRALCRIITGGIGVTIRKNGVIEFLLGQFGISEGRLGLDPPVGVGVNSV